MTEQLKCRCGQKITDKTIDKCLICGFPYTKEVLAKLENKKEEEDK